MDRPPETLTLDEVASLTDAGIVRRRFDSGNIRWLGVLSALAFFVAVAQILQAVSEKPPQPYLISLAAGHLITAFLAAAFFGELSYWQRRHGAWKPRVPIHLIARNLTPWVVAFFVVEFTFVTFLRHPKSSSWIAWALIFPWLLTPIRLETSRRIALHLSLLMLVVLNVTLLGVREKRTAPEYTTILICNGIALLLGTVFSRRLRRRTIEDWTERRGQAREQLRMREELQYAREVQLAMLPESSPSMTWVDLAGTSVPATEVGGDYYDYIVDEDGVAIICADVAGHGLASAIVLASLRSGFMLLRDSLRDPAAVLQRLGDLVAHTSRRRMIATAAVVRLDHASRRAIIASAGHPPVMLRRSRAVETIELFAPPLGVRLPYRVPSRQLAFESGDVFVLHSDGMYESQNAAGEMYGLDRLAQLLSGLDHAGAAEIRDAILRDVEVFRAGAAQQDDITIVVARVV